MAAGAGAGAADEGEERATEAVFDGAIDGAAVPFAGRRSAALVSIATGAFDAEGAMERERGDDDGEGRRDDEGEEAADDDDCPLIAARRWRLR